MVKTGWIDIDDGLYIHDWEEWQEQWYKAIEIRKKDAARKREERRKKRILDTDNISEIHTSSLDIAEAMEPDLQPANLTISKESNPQKQHTVTRYNKEFEEFWSIYPRKVGKGEAYKMYKARVNDGFSEAELLEAATNYANKCAVEHTEEKYIKHGKTFLSANTPFLDYIKLHDSSQTLSESNEDDESYENWREL